MIRKIKLIIEYDGTNYGGWQVQPNAVTIQEEIEKAIYKVTGEKIRIHGAGRTDAGVHALAQAAHFETSTDIPSDRIKLAINTHLKPDIRIKESLEVNEDFHARFSAKGKIYKYSIYNDRAASAILRNTTHSVKEKLDIESMKRAAKSFLGEHDFTAFCSAGTDVEDKVRTIYDVKITDALPLIEIFFEGNGFLYNMVRIMAGTLIDVGRGKIAPDHVEGIIRSKNREKASPTAPAKGLCLLEVKY